MTDRKAIVYQIVSLWLIALALRVGHLLLSLSQIGLQRLSTLAPDTGAYRLVAEYFLSGGTVGEETIFQVGPGYGLILAALEWLFGPDPLPTLVFSVFMGSLGPVLVYLLAYCLIRSRTVALITGIFVALSTTSISLSCMVLSDQPFFTIHAAALVCFVLGFRTGKTSWFVAAGIIAGLATLVRGTSQFWWFVFALVGLVVPVPERFPSRLAVVRKACLTGGVMLIMVLTWSARNYLEHDIFVFGGNGVSAARAYSAALAVANHTEDADILDIRERWVQEDREYFGDHEPTMTERYYRARDHLWHTLTSHPDWFLEVFLSSVKGNVLTGNYMVRSQTPEFLPLWNRLNAIHGKWFAHLLFYTALLGLVFLVADRQHLAWILLGLTYCYFTLITGFSFWQGSRLHYPATMAWAILVSYALCRLAFLSCSLITLLNRKLDLSARFRILARKSSR
ncbi:MAG: glycosyltransferase family 39 protein [candidate division Zixibacteria bacterium]|nr:glycosyltransferase family 39 protein [candidate division Zixibacteria bacterium]